MFAWPSPQYQCLLDTTQSTTLGHWVLRGAVGAMECQHNTQWVRKRTKAKMLQVQEIKYQSMVAWDCKATIRYSIDWVRTKRLEGWSTQSTNTWSLGMAPGSWSYWSGRNQLCSKLLLFFRPQIDFLDVLSNSQKTNLYNHFSGKRLPDKKYAWGRQTREPQFVGRS